MSGSITRRIRTWAAALVAVTGTATMQAEADTFYVNGSCGNDAWTGTSSVCAAPNGPKRTIQGGIDASVTGDTVIVADGTYTGNGNRDLDFGGRDIQLRSESLDPTMCIIDCDGRQDDPHRGFYFHSGETGKAVVDGLTIRNGVVTDASPGGPRGGGILCDGASSPTIVNCVIIENQCAGTGYYRAGGGIACDSSSPTIENCVISGNSVGGVTPCGGGIACFASSPAIRNCTITGNSAVGYDFEACGGGIYSDEFGSPTITDCTISGNWASEIHAAFGGGILCGADTQITGCTITENAVYAAFNTFGGGIYCYRGNPKIASCTISRNTSAGSEGGRGGGVYAYLSSATLTNCTFTGNNALNSQDARGGAIYDNQGSLTINSCTITENFTEGYGGGAYCSRSDTTLTNCILSGNQAGVDGGGAYCVYNIATLANCTLSGNQAGADGGGIYCAYESSVSISNCTLAENWAPNGRALACDSQRPSNVEITNCILRDGGDEVWNNDGSTITIRYSDIQGGWAGEGNIDADPLFVTDPTCGDYFLSPDSPCIDAADNTAVPPGVTSDLCGNPRFVDDPATLDTGNGDPPIVDMGAYEFPCDPCDMNCDGQINAFDIEPFLDLLFNPNAQPCAPCTGDVDGNGEINAFDIEPFLSCLFP